MATVPTNQMERELRKLYLQWLAGLPRQKNTAAYLDKFQRDSTALISRLGGQTASLGALAGFPVPKTLALSPRAGTIYDEMKQAAISASITAGLNSRDAARQMLNAGLDKGYKKLERLARTETVSAYWKNQWDSVADLPLIVMVWGSEESNKTCRFCLDREGLVVEDSNIRDHPNGRCTLVPTLRSQVKYRGTLQPDGSVDMDPRWAAQKVKGAKALDSSTPATAEQLDPTSSKRNPAAPSTAQAAQASGSGVASAREVASSKIVARDVLTPQRDTTLSAAQYKKAMDRGDVLARTAANVRDEIIHSTDTYMKILSKQKRIPLPALKQKLASTAQELVDNATPSVMINSSDLGGILANGFKTTRQTGTGIGGGEKAYIATRDVLEDAYYGPGKNPVYGFFDSPAVKGRGTLDDYGDVKVVLNDDVRKRATASLGDSLDERIMPAPATAMDEYAIKNRSGLLSEGGDSIKDYIEMQVADLTVSDIAEVVFKTTPPQAMQAKLLSLGIRWRLQPPN